MDAGTKLYPDRDSPVDQVQVFSAGSAPVAAVNAVVVQAMAELGIAMSQEFLKPVTSEVVAAADVV